MQISIIIPTYNEADNIGHLIQYLQRHSKKTVSEIVVCDGGSQDNTLDLAKQHGATPILSPSKGRAAQMNYAASRAKGDILYFVHADSIPPSEFEKDILKCISGGIKSGCYRFKFNSDNPFLKLNAWFTRFNLLVCRGGDQTLFIEKNLFNELGGYDEKFIIMEEYELIKKLKKKNAFCIIQKDVLVSARKYEKNSYFRVNLANFIVFNMYRLGFPPMRLHKTYQKLINHPKR